MQYDICFILTADMLAAISTIRPLAVYLLFQGASAAAAAETEHRQP
jgi:hypothetical protein